MTDFEPRGNGSQRKYHNWNFSNVSNQDNPKSLELVGTLVGMQKVQSMNWQKKKPEFWPDGNPKWDLRLILATAQGNIKTWRFKYAQSKGFWEGRYYSPHVDLAKLAGSMANLMGKTIHVTTWDANPETGVPWGPGNPRKFAVELVDTEPYHLTEEMPAIYKVPELLADNGANGGQMNNQRPPMQQGYQQPYMQQPMQPQYQPQPQQYVQPMQPQQPMPQQSLPQGYNWQPVPPQQPQQQAVQPQPMNPTIAQNMQQQEVYDDLPF